MIFFHFSYPYLKYFFNNTKGLLGVWNGNSEDDFLRPDGTHISTNSNESVIFDQFGEKCMYVCSVHILQVTSNNHFMLFCAHII